jgi:hypothetical protein
MPESAISGVVEKLSDDVTKPCSLGRALKKVIEMIEAVVVALVAAVTT